MPNRKNIQLTQLQIRSLSLKGELREFLDKLAELEVGEGLLLSNDLWRGRGYNPSAYVRSHFARQGKGHMRFKLRQSAELAGWGVVRVENTEQPDVDLFNTNKENPSCESLPFAGL